MAKLISEKDIKSLSILESTVDNEGLGIIINNAQETQLKPVLGKGLYDDLQSKVKDHLEGTLALTEFWEGFIKNYIKPFLVWSVTVDFITLGNFKFTNKGILKLSDNAATNPSDDDIHKLRAYCVNILQHYKTSLENYIVEQKLVDVSQAQQNSTAPTIGWFLDKDPGSDIYGDYQKKNLSTEVDPVFSSEIKNYYKKSEVDALLDGLTISNEVDPIWSAEKANYATTAHVSAAIAALTKVSVGLGNVDNTSDLNKPISTATQIALDGKASLVHNHDDRYYTEAEVIALLSEKAAAVHTHTKAEVGLSNVDNTSDLNKPISTATQAALDLKSGVGHTHDDRYYTEAETDALLADKAAATHDHPEYIDELELTAELLGKSDIDHTHTKDQVGLANVDNTSDANKPISTATQAALDEKADVGHTHPATDITQDSTHRFVTDAEKTTWNDKQNALGYTPVPDTRTVNGHALNADVTITKGDVGLSNVNNTSDANKPISTATQTALDGKVPTTRTVNGQALSADVTISKADVGLSNVDNTSDANKPVSTTTQAALDLKANKSTTINGHDLSSNVTITKGDVGLGNVDNTADANKPISTATQTALDAKADLVGGKVPTSQLPAISMSEFLGDVASEAAMLALTGEPGDWIIRTDQSKTYILIAEDPTQVASWKAIVTPAAPVQSVNGHGGVVVLDKTDIGLSNVDNTSDLNKPISTSTQVALNAKVPTTRTVNGLALSADITLNKSHVGLGQVDNTSDADKPISTAVQDVLTLKAPLNSPTLTGLPAAPTAAPGTSTIQLATTEFVTTAVNLKANIASPTFTGTPAAPTAAGGTNTTQVATTAFVQSEIANKQPLDADLTTIAGLSTAVNDVVMQVKSNSWTVRTPAQLKTDLSLTKSDVGLSNVDNTSDANKPISTATQAALDAKQPLDSDLTTIAGLSTAVNDVVMQVKSNSWTVRTPGQLKTDLSLTKNDVGLGNVDNTSDANKPISSSTQTALNAKAPLASPVLTGTPTAPTAAEGTNTTQIATTAFVQTNVNSAVNTAITNASSNYQPLDSDLSAIAGLVPTNGDFIQRESGSWASRTPAQAKTSLGLVKADVGLSNVDNTSDANKPISTATQTALDAKVPTTRTVNGYALSSNVTLAKADVGLSNVDNTSDANKPISTATQTALNAKADLVGGKVPTSQIPSVALSEFKGTVTSEASMTALGGERGDWCIRLDEGKTYILIADDATLASNWQYVATPAAPVQSVNGQSGVVVLVKSDIGLGNVDNTSDASKPVSTAQQTALNLKANLASPTFTGTPSLPTGTVGVTQTAGDNSTKLATTAYVDSGLSGKANTSHTHAQSDITNLTSDLAAKAPIASPTFTGTPAAPTASVGTNTTQLATTAFVQSALSGLSLSGFYSGTGSPEAVVTANVGSIYRRTDGGTSTTLYIKESGTGNTGWVVANPVVSVAGKTGAVTLAKADVGLSNVDNTSDASKPVSTAQQTALDLKSNIASPTFTGTPAAPTASAGTNTTQLATTAFVTGAISTAAANYQPVDADLTTIAGLSTASNDVIMQVKSNAWTVRTPAQLKTDLVLVKADVGLGNVENTALSTWTGNTAVTSVGTIATGTWNATAIGPTKGGLGFTSWSLGQLVYGSGSNTVAQLAGNTSATKMVLTQTGNGTVSAAPAWGTLAKADVGLSNVDNTSDASKPVSTAQQTALDLKANLSAPTFTGNVTLSNGNLVINDVTISRTGAGVLSFGATTLRADSLINVTATANGQISVADGGVSITRNTADAIAALTINLQHASSTGKILDLKAAGTSVLTVDKTGALDATAYKLNGGTIFTEASGVLSIGTGGGITAVNMNKLLTNTVAGEQLRLAYNSGNYTSFTTSSGGDLTVAPSGGDMTLSGNVYAGGGATGATVNDGAGTAFTPQVTVSNTAQAAIAAFANDGTNNRRIGMFVDNTNGVAGLSLSQSSSAFPFVIRNTNGEQFRINANGTLKISAYSPGILKINGSGDVSSGTVSQSDVTNLTTDLAAKAPLASPTFTGTATLNGTNSASSGTYKMTNLVPSINQTSTAGYVGYYASVHEQAVGSTGGKLIDVGTNSLANGAGTHTSKFWVDNAGHSAQAGTLYVQQLATLNGGATMPTGTTLKIFNTSDQVTNTEFASMGFTSNVFTVDVNETGTGTLRNMEIKANGATITIGDHSVADAAMDIHKSGTMLSTYSIRGTSTLSSGIFSSNAIYPTINQSGTAGYNGLFISPYEQATGSGAKYLIRAGTNSAADAGGTHTDKFTVDNAGTITAFNIPKRVFLPSNVVNNNATANTLADVTGLQFPVTANKKYWFKFTIYFTSAATSTGSRWSINGPALTALAAHATWTISVNGVKTDSKSAYDGGTSSSTSAGTSNLAVIEGLIQCSAGGNVVARFCSAVSSSAITAVAGMTNVEYMELDN